MGSVRNAGHGALRVVLPRLLGASVAIVCALTLVAGTAFAFVSDEEIVRQASPRRPGDICSEFVEKQTAPDIGDAQRTGEYQTLVQFGHYETVAEETTLTRKVLSTMHISNGCGEAFGYYGGCNRETGEMLPGGVRSKQGDLIDWDYVLRETVRYNEHGGSLCGAVGYPGPSGGAWVDTFFRVTTTFTPGEVRWVKDFTCYADAEGNHNPDCPEPGHHLYTNPVRGNPMKHYDADEARALPAQPAATGGVPEGAHEATFTHRRIVWPVYIQSQDGIVKPYGRKTTESLADFTCWALPDGSHWSGCGDASHVSRGVIRVVDEDMTVTGAAPSTDDVLAVLADLESDGYDTSAFRAKNGLPSSDAEPTTPSLPETPERPDGVPDEAVRADFTHERVVHDVSISPWDGHFKPLYSLKPKTETVTDFICWAMPDGSHWSGCTDPSHVVRDDEEVWEVKAERVLGYFVDEHGNQSWSNPGAEDAVLAILSDLEDQGYDTSAFREANDLPASEKTPAAHPGTGSSSGATVPIYRLYNTRTEEHLYTSSSHERDVLASGGEWLYESVGWNAPKTGTPVYRVYNSRIDDHLYTDEHEATTLAAQPDWTMDNDGKPLFYSGGDVELYRLYHYASERHLITRDPNEYNTLPGKGWLQEGVKMHAVS